MGGGFGEKAFWGEAGEGVDLQQVGLEGFLVDHDVHAGQIAGADGGVGFFGELAAELDELCGEAGVEAVFGVASLVFGFVVEELDLGDDANGGEGFFFEDADGELGALDELLGEGFAVFAEDGFQGLVDVALGLADEDVHAGAGIDGLDDQGGLEGGEALAVDQLVAGGGQAGFFPDALGLDLVHSEARGGGAGADEAEVAFFELGLELAVFAPGSVEDGEDDVGGVFGRVDRVGEGFGADVGFEDLVSRVAQALRDGFAGDERDFTFGGGAAVEDGDFHVIFQRELRSGW